MRRIGPAPDAAALRSFNSGGGMVVAELAAGDE